MNKRGLSFGSDRADNTTPPEYGETINVRPVDGKLKILFLTANPEDTTRLKLAKEFRHIQNRIRECEFRDRIDLEIRQAVHHADLRLALLEEKPHIVHFSGHGSTSDELILQDDKGNSHPVSCQAVGALFKTLKDDVRLVVFNACFSNSQAEGIVENIAFAIGMNQAIGDESAIRFAGALYQAIGFGMTVQEAFDLGRNELQLARSAEDLTPQLLHHPDADPSETRLIKVSSKPLWKTLPAVAIVCAVFAIVTVLVFVVTNMQGRYGPNLQSPDHSAMLAMEKQRFELELQQAERQKDFFFKLEKVLTPDFAEKLAANPPVAALPPEKLPVVTIKPTKASPYHPHPFASDIIASGIKGADDRQRVVDTTIAPYNAICLLEMVSANGTPIMSTGFLVDQSTVVAAGHSVYNHDSRYGVGAMRSINVYFGRDKTDSQGTATAISTHSTKQWVNSSDPAFDYAAIRLDTPIPIEPLNLAVVSDDALMASMVNISGYPADKNQGSMYGTVWGSVDNVVAVRANSFLSLCDTTGGMTGAPILRHDEESGYSVVGIHVGSGIGGVRITDAVRENIEGWIK